MDFYKFTMGQFVFNHYPRTQVKYAFKCRTQGVRLADVLSLKDIQAQLDSARELHFSGEELQYLYGLTGQSDKAYFSEEYIRFLTTFQLPPYRLDSMDGDLILEFAGPWHQAIYWETIALSIVNEMYNLKNFSLLEGLNRKLEEKIVFMKDHPDIKFADFGTRRRSSERWHSQVLKRIAEEIPSNFIGTSNVFFSKVYNRKPVGTFAHELLMIPTAVVLKKKPTLDTLIDVNEEILYQWFKMYGKDLAIALSDTYGSDLFFSRIFHTGRAIDYNGVRQDSGDPFVFGEQAIKFYQHNHIEPLEKTIVFSDGLEPWKMDQLQQMFGKKINVRFGWGTNLTNDSGVTPLSIVVKPVMADGEACVKLSDNLAKANGHKNAVAGYKKLIGYNGEFFEQCKY